MPNFNLFTPAITPWVLLLVFSLGLRIGALRERSNWMRIVVIARRAWSLDYVLEYAVKTSGAPIPDQNTHKETP